MSDWDKLRSVPLRKKYDSIMDKYKGGSIPMPKPIQLKLDKLNRLINKVTDKEFGIVSKKGRSLYSATKFGLIGLTKSTALDLAKYNILVNSVSPGVINVGLTKKILNSTEAKKIKREIPLNKLGEALDVSLLVCFLCSNFNNYITGQNFVIDGGYTSK